MNVLNIVIVGAAVLSAFSALVGLASSIMTIHNYFGDHRNPTKITLWFIACMFIFAVILACVSYFVGRASTPEPSASANHPTPTPSLAATFAPTIVSTQTPTPTSALGIDTLTDDFNAGSVPNGTKWQVYADGGATVVVSMGQLVITPTKAVRSQALTSSNHLYNALGESAFIQVLQVAGGSTVDTAFGFQNPDASNAIQMVYSDGELEITTYTGSTLFVTPYNPTTQQWWRLRESGGMTYADVSYDGRTWVTIYQHPDIFDMSLVRVFMAAKEWAADPTAGGAKFAHFNQI